MASQGPVVTTSWGRLPVASRELKLSGPMVTLVSIFTARLTSPVPPFRCASTKEVTSHS